MAKLGLHFIFRFGENVTGEMELGRKMLVPMSGKVEEVGVPRTHRPLKSAYSKIEQEEDSDYMCVC